MTTAITTRGNILATFFDSNVKLDRFTEDISFVDFDAEIAADKEVLQKYFSDEDILRLYGSEDAWYAKRKDFVRAKREIIIDRLTSYITDLASIRFFADVTLYDGYDPDHARELAQDILARKLDKSQENDAITESRSSFEM